MNFSINSDAGQAPLGVYETVLSLLEDIDAKVILDVPCGMGILSEKLKWIGFDVIALDLEEKKYVPEDNKVVVADLNEGVPFKDASFDMVVSIEGIEHLKDTEKTIKEIYRVLKNGGYLILSTPNVINLRSRCKFLIRGELFWFDEVAIERFGHISPQLPFILEHLLSKIGFRILKVSMNNRPRLFNRLFWILMKMCGTIGKYRMNLFRYINAESLVFFCQKDKKTLGK